MLQDGIVDLLRVNDSGALFKIRNELDGFHHILEDKLFNNDFHDVHAINAPPNCSHGPPRDEHFVYYEYLPPGHHQFVIYDPKVSELYTHDLVVGMNTKEIFTDFPRKKAVIKRNVVDMWRNWREDTEADLNEMCQLDSASKYYEPQKVIRDKE